MTSRHKNSSHGRFSKKQKKASRTMMLARKGYKFDRHSTGPQLELGKAGLLATILPFLFSKSLRGARR